MPTINRMKRLNWTAFFVVQSLAFVCSTANPACADSMIKDGTDVRLALIDATTNGAASGTLLFNGTPVRIDKLWTTFEERRLRLDRLISSNIMHGKLTTAQAIAYRKELESVAEDLYKYVNADSLSTERALAVASRLDSISQRLTKSVSADELPRLMVIDDISGQSTLVSDFFGNLVASNPTDLNLFKETLRQRRSQLRAVIAAGQSTAALNPTQTDALRSELDGLNGLEKTLMESNPPRYSHLMQLAIHYDSIRARLAQLMDGYEMQPLIRDSAVIVGGNRVVSLDDPMKRRAIIEDRISSELAQGHLTGQEGARLRTMLNRLATKEGDFRKKDGALTPNARKQVNSDLDKISGALKSAINM